MDASKQLSFDFLLGEPQAEPDSSNKDKTADNIAVTTPVSEPALTEPAPETVVVSEIIPEPTVSEQPVIEQPAPVASDDRGQKPKSLKFKGLKRAAIGWLLDQNPTGIGTKVPTRFSRYLADVAAFWSVPRKKVLHPEKTVIVEIRTHREMCWPDCANKDELLPKLKALKEQRLQLEAEIRKTEPELRDSDTLFDEFDIWNYSQSSNKEYQKCRKQIEYVEHALYQGSRFEQIRRGYVANELYLAVPAGEVHPHELADGWGLLYVTPELEVEVIKEADFRECPESNKLHLIQKIAATNTASLCFANGIYQTRQNDVVFLKVPHRRRIPKQY